MPYDKYEMLTMKMKFLLKKKSYSHLITLYHFKSLVS